MCDKRQVDSPGCSRPRTAPARKGAWPCGRRGCSQSEPRPPPGSAGRRGPGCLLAAAPGASAELCATLLRPGGEPALPPARGDLQDRALHLPPGHRGGLHGDRGDQNRQVGLRGCVCACAGAVALSSPACPPHPALPRPGRAQRPDPALLAHRRSIHSQEMLGQLLTEVGGAWEGPPGSLCPGPARCCPGT